MDEKEKGRRNDRRAFSPYLASILYTSDRIYSVSNTSKVIVKHYSLKLEATLLLLAAIERCRRLCCFVRRGVCQGWFGGSALSACWMTNGIQSKQVTRDSTVSVESVSLMH